METSLARLIERGGTESLSNKYNESKVHLAVRATIKVYYSHPRMDLKRRYQSHLQAINQDLFHSHAPPVIMNDNKQLHLGFFLFVFLNKSI